MKNKTLTTVLLVSGIVLGYGLCIFFENHVLNCSISYTYLNPHLGCRNKPVIDKAAYLEFEGKLASYIKQEHSDGNLVDIGVYFRDLEDGPIFGINESKLFISASLIKLPTIMTVMRYADQNPGFLESKILYAKEIPSENQDFAPAKKLVVGESYTVSDLVDRTLEYSDNAANELLIDELQRVSPDDDLISDTFRDLGLSVPNDVTKGDLSTKSFSSLLRLLYSASFLSKDNSEKILSLLDKAAFKQGLEMGVPQGIRVASKFGERELDFSSNGKITSTVDELHDCGIIYYPQNPYLLCVMTKGKDFNQLSKIIGSISKMVYDEFDSRRIN